MMEIVLVDDEQLALGSIVSTVQKVVPDSVLHPFGNPMDALSYFQEGGQADVAFLDVEMFGIDGISLAKKIRDISQRTNIIFVTGFSDYALEAIHLHASGYLLKPASAEDVSRELDNLRIHMPSAQPTCRVRIQTFGNFEIFADEKPVSFPREKSKEILAYLVDRNGAGVTVGELAGVIWEDREFSRSLANQLQVMISSMRKALREAGAEDIIIKSRNSISVDKTKVDCDYFRFLEGDTSAINSYMGEYMVNYGWAEFTTGYIEQKLNHTKNVNKV